MRGRFLRAAAWRGGSRQGVLARSLPETRAYIAAVEAADGEQLELPVLQALCDLANWRIPLGGQFVPACGARTLAGALVPMVGIVPTGVNLVGGDYSRTAGIAIEERSSNKKIELNRNVDTYSAANRHTSFWLGAARAGNTVDVEHWFGGQNLPTSDVFLTFQSSPGVMRVRWGQQVGALFALPAAPDDIFPIGLYGHSSLAGVGSTARTPYGGNQAITYNPYPDESLDTTAHRVGARGNATGSGVGIPTAFAMISTGPYIELDEMASRLAVFFDAATAALS